jgi:hypothetical protein
MTSLEDNRWRLEWGEYEAVEDTLRHLVVQGPLPSDGAGLFRYWSGVDQNDLVDQAPRYCYKKAGMMQLKTILPPVFEMRVIV